MNALPLELEKIIISYKDDLEQNDKYEKVLKDFKSRFNFEELTSNKITRCDLKKRNITVYGYLDGNNNVFYSRKAFIPDILGYLLGLDVDFEETDSIFIEEKLFERTFII